MLVLSREPGQTIVINNDTIIEVLSVRGQRVRLGVTSPGKPIHRGEIHAQLQREGRTEIRSRAAG